MTLLLWIKAEILFSVISVPTYNITKTSTNNTIMESDKDLLLEILRKGQTYAKQKNYQEAVSMYRMTADHGYAPGQFALGQCYYLGNGVQQDYTEAVKWFRKAAEQENVGAQYNLGVCYEYGDGVVKDIAEAVKWYRKAAEQGDEDAKKKA